MARIRTIKPEFFLDEDVANLHPLTRILFTALWCLADKAGRLEDRPQRIKIQALPYDDHDVDGALDDLSSAGFIIRYSTKCGQNLIQIKSFEKHQKTHCTEKESTLPPCNGEITVKEPLNNGYETTGKERKGKERNIDKAGRGVGKPSEPEPKKHLPVDNPLPPLPEDDTQDPPSESPDRKQPVEEKPKNQNPKTPQSDTPGPKPPEPPPRGNTHGERWTKQQGDELDVLMNDIRDRYGERYHQQVLTWAQTNYIRKNPAAMLHCLRRLISDRMAGKPIPLPGKWLDAVLNGNGEHPGENGKFEAEEAERECDQHKREPVALGAIFRGMGARA